MMRWVLLLVVAILLIVGGIVLFRPAPPPLVQAPTTLPTTAPATAPASRPAEKPADYMDVVGLSYPDFPTTQPLMVPVNLPEAARLIIDDPIYLDMIGELWISRNDAEPTSSMFKRVQEQSTHVLHERVVYVHRYPDETGVWQPQLVCRKDNGRYEILTRVARQDLESNFNYDWSRASSWNDAIVVPTDRGISVIRPDRLPMELHYDLVSEADFDPARYSTVQALLDWRGLLAWMPWEGEKLGSDGAVRYVNGQFSRLGTTEDWPKKLLHLVPLLDGSVIQLIVGDDKNVKVSLAVLDPPQVDEKKIVELVDQLSDPDPTTRVNAFNTLTQYGSSIWPILEKLLPDQLPEARIRMQQLLLAKTQATLGGMIVQPGPMEVLARSDFGGMVLLSAPAGVLIPRDLADDPLPVAPAYIRIYPGRAIELAHTSMVEELQGKGRQLRIVRGEFILNDDIVGPRWWLSNHFSPPLLKKKELDFKHVVGLDGRGRWLFQKAPDQPTPTLIIDPTLPDPTPRLPVWIYKGDMVQVGWSEKDWPAIKRGGAWALEGGAWNYIDETKEKFIPASNLPPGAANNNAAPAPAPATAPATTIASTAPSTTQSSEPPILVDKDGTRYYDGRETLRRVDPSGHETVWPLPPEAVGSGEVTLLNTGEYGLFLFNQPGRVLRIKPTPDKPEPFKLEATFTKRIPNDDHPHRIWLDPAGRIIIAYGDHELAICFPAGRIPREIATKMTAADLKDAEED
jgi:hypothetical protein